MPERAYHHGDLRNALVQAGVELAREGGPEAIVLREAARRVQVSPNAAYRHFTDLDALVGAVARAAFEELGASMRTELARLPAGTDARSEAWAATRAVGRGYVHFALREPGMFAVAFEHKHAGPAVPADTGPDSPMGILLGVLGRLVEVGSLRAEDLEASRITAWSLVHGLSQLLLGPLAGMPYRSREAVIDASLDQIGQGLLRRET